MKQGIKIGLIGGVVAVLLSLIGMVEAFSPRYVISNVISMGHTLLLLIGVFFGYFSAQRTKWPGPFWILLNTLISGFLVGVMLTLLVLLGNVVKLRSIFINASPALYDLLTFKEGLENGTFLLLAAGAFSGILAGLFYLMPGLLRRVLITSFGSVIAAGVLQDLLQPTFAAWGPLAVINDWLFTANGLTPHGALTLFILIAVITS
jgi:branched-chain amino acid transport system permease protein